MIIRLALVVASGLLLLTLAADPAAAQVTCTAPPAAPANAAASVTALGNLAAPASVSVAWVPSTTTGPNAVTSYRIEVGSEPGTADVAIIDTGTTTASSEQFANNGTYYVRVRAQNACGLSTASPEPTLTITGSLAAGRAGARLVASTAAVTTGSLGNVVVTGAVKGAWGSAPATFVRANATFYGPAGNVIGTDFAYVNGRPRRLSSGSTTDTTLGAGESGCFYMYTSYTLSQVERTTASTSWNTSSATALAGNVVVQGPLTLSTSFFGDLTVSGLLANVGSRLTYFNKAFFDVRNAQDRVIDCDFGYVTGSTVVLSSGISTDTALLPGQTGAFTNFNRVPRSGVTRVISWPAWQEANSAAASAMTSAERDQWTSATLRGLSATDHRGRNLERKATTEQLELLLGGGDQTR